VPSSCIGRNDDDLDIVLVSSIWNKCNMLERPTMYVSVMVTVNVCVNNTGC